MADPIRQHKLVTVQESMLDGMAHNEKFTREFPFLKGLTLMPRASCRSCGGGSISAARSKTYAAAKRQLASMSVDNKRKLKELLNTKQIRITYRHDNGKVIELTF